MFLEASVPAYHGGVGGAHLMIAHQPQNCTQYHEKDLFSVLMATSGKNPYLMYRTRFLPLLWCHYFGGHEPTYTMLPFLL